MMLLLDLGLPPGADFEEFKKYRFCTIGNSSWFQGRNGSFFKGTNYRVTPLFTCTERTIIKGFVK